MTGAIGGVWVDVGAKVAPNADKTIRDGIVPSAEKTGQEAGKKMGDGLAKSLKFAAAAIGTAGVLSLFKDSIAEASDLTEAINKTDVVIGSASDSVKQFASTAATSIGQSSSQALAAASDFAVFGKSAGLSGEALADFSTDMVTLASDMASFSNTSPEQAITAIGAAFRGETEPIRAYGVMLDDATMRQKAMELGITETTKNALTPQQKVLAAHALILEQTADAQGDFARNSDEASNSQKILTAMWTDAKAQLGAGLLPAVKDFLGALRDSMPAIAGFLQSIGGIAGSGLKLGVPLLEAAAKAIEYIDKVVPGGASSVAAYIAVWQGVRHFGGFAKIFTDMGNRVAAMSEHLGNSAETAGRVRRGFMNIGGAMSALSVAAPIAIGLFSVVNDALKRSEENIKAVVDQWQGPFFESMYGGGDAAAKAAADIAGMNDKITELESGGVFMAKVADDMSKGMGQASLAAKEQYAALTPLEKQQQALTAAQADYQAALEEYGPQSQEAAAASAALQAANAQVEATQNQVTEATQSSTAALQEWMNQQLAATNADFAAQLATLQVADAQKAYNDSLVDGTMSAADKQRAEIALGTAVTASAQAAANKAAEEAKAAGITDTATIENHAMIASLQQYAAQAGANTPAAITELIASLKGQAGQSDATAGAADNVSGAVAGAGGSASTASGQVGGLTRALKEVPGSTNPQVNANGNYAEAEGVIGELGSRITGLRDKTVTVTTKYVTLGALGSGLIPGNAAGGAIYGPGTGTSDSVLRRLSNGEHVLTADDVRDAGGQRAIYELRRMIQAGWKVPGYAEGGAVGSSPSGESRSTTVAMPSTLVVVDVDGTLLARMKVAANQQISTYDRTTGFTSANRLAP